MMRFTCPDCTRKLQVSDDRAGQVVSCPFCGHKICLPPAVKSVSVAGIVSFLAAALALCLTVVSIVVKDVWQRHVATGEWPTYRTFAGIDLSELPELLAKINVVAVVLMGAGLAMAGLSFLGTARKHWSLAGLAVNGMLLLWKLST